MSIPESYRTSVTDRSTFITQTVRTHLPRVARFSHAVQDHPYLNLPFYYVHPCQTSKLLAEAGLRYDTALDVLKSALCVLSIAGPIVSLTYPHEWFVLAPLKEVRTLYQSRYSHLSLYCSEQTQWRLSGSLRTCGRPARPPCATR